MSEEFLSPKNISGNERMYKVLWRSGLAIISSMLVIAFITHDVLMFKIGTTEFNWGPTLLELVIFLVALSVKEVGAEEISGAFFYGMALKRLNPGPHFVPFGLMQIRKSPKPVQEFQCPGEPDQVFKGDDKEELPPGMVRPIRVVTGAQKNTSGGLLDTQMTITVSFYFQYVIENIFDFVSNFAGETSQIEKQLRDIGESTVAEIAAKETPESVIEKLPEINKQLLTEVEKRFENSGVRIIAVRLISPDVSHEVSKALASIPLAKAEAKTAAIKSEGEKTKLTNEGKGVAAARLAMLSAEAEGRKKMMDDLGVSGDAVLAAETASSLAQSPGNTLIIGAEGGMRDILGAVTAAQTVLKLKKGE